MDEKGFKREGSTIDNKNYTKKDAKLFENLSVEDREESVRDEERQKPR